jgi:hypothetical protein
MVLDRARSSQSRGVRVVVIGYSRTMAKKGPPKLVTLAHDEYHAEYVGTTTDKRQFFLTTPFVPETKKGTGREFIALYLFDKNGALIEAIIEDFGTRKGLDHERRMARRDALLKSLGKVRHGTIKFAPFKVERFGVEFGFIAQPPDEPDGEWSVIAEPGNFMCFWPPWTSGDYDT